MCDPRAAFTTLGVPVFFLLAFPVAHFVSVPAAVLLSPLLLRLALVVVPAPARLSPPSCPHLARREAEQAAGAARRAAQRATRAAQVAPEVHKETRPTVPIAAPMAPSLAVATPAPADARRAA
jgi:hypothetical protein